MKFISSLFEDLYLIRTILHTGQGLDEIRKAILGKLEKRIDLTAKPHAVISERHRGILKQGEEELCKALEMMKAGREDLVALVSAHMRSALDLIGTATGRSYEESLLDTIFSRFCIGK